MTSPVFAERLLSSYDSTVEAFDAMDRDGDRCLSEEELGAGTAALRQPLTKQEAEYAFSGLDANSDLFVCRQEFLGVLRVGRFFQTAVALKQAGFDVGRPKSLYETEEATTSTTPMAASDAETLSQPISLAEFKLRMGKSAPAPLQALAKPHKHPDAGWPEEDCLDLQVFRQAAGGFKPPLSIREIDYAFVGMDANHDKKVCSAEFLGTLEIGHFFASVQRIMDFEVWQKHAQLDTSTTAPPTTTSATALEQGSPYTGVPAIVSGHAELTLRLAADSLGPTGTEKKALGEIFRRAMEHNFGLSVNIADTESVHLNGIGNPHDRTLMILWTAGNIDDGGALKLNLQKRGDDVKAHIEKSVGDEAYAWLQHSSLWATISMNFYGPGASQLPEGSQVSLEIGHKVAGVGAATQ